MSSKSPVKNRGIEGLLYHKTKQGSLEPELKPIDSPKRVLAWSAIWLARIPIIAIAVPFYIVGGIIYTVTEGIPRKMCGQTFFISADRRVPDEAYMHGHGS